MTDINLLKYLNLSHSEIYQIEHGDVTEDQSEQVTLQQQKQKKLGKKLPSYFLYLAGLILAIILGIILYFSLFTEEEAALTTNINQKDNVTIEKKPQLIQNKEFKPIGTITFSKEQPKKPEPQPIKKPTPKPVKPKKIVKPKPQKKMVTPKPVPKPAPIKKSKPMVKVDHYVAYLDISRNELIKLKKVVQQSNKKYIVDRTKLKKKTLWQLYKRDANGTKVIADRKVKFIKSFNTKDLAVNYAKKHNVPAIILSKKTEERFYFINVYPFTSKQDANKFKKRTTFIKKSVKIHKGKP